MQQKKRVSANTRTHSWDKVKVEDPEFEVANSSGSNLLIDIEDYESGSTHSDRPIKTKRLKAALYDDESAVRQNTYMPNDEDPADAYLEQEAGMPVTYVESNDDVEDLDLEENLEAELDDDVEDDLEEDLEASDEDEFSELGESYESFTPAAYDDIADDAGHDAEIEADEAEDFTEFEAPLSTDEVPLVDADAISDEDTMLEFSVIANVVHAIKGNRIIASISPNLATKAKVQDVYLTPQFQEVVADTVSRRGLRKGLVASGFVLAKIKAANTKVQATTINAKVKASLTKHLTAQAKKDKAMSQSLAIAAVGINRNFFKGATNELRSALEEELVNAGVRGGAKIVRAMFNKHGVDYAHAILTLANKISAMPDEIRDAYAENLDLVNDDTVCDEDVEVESEYEDEDGMEDFEPTAISVSAALRNPIRKNVGALLKASNSSTATAILSGSQSLI